MQRETQKEIERRAAVTLQARACCTTAGRDAEVAISRTRWSVTAECRASQRCVQQHALIEANCRAAPTRPRVKRTLLRNGGSAFVDWHAMNDTVDKNTHAQQQPLRLTS